MNSLKLLVLAALLPAVVMIGAASAQDHPAKEHPAESELPSAAEVADDSVLAVAAADGRFTQFVAAVEAAGLAEKLQGGGPFTVFAPTDSAFAKLPEGTLADLMKPANKARLAGLLAGHVVPGNLAIAEAKTMKASNVNGHDLKIRVADDKVTVDGACVVGKELVAGNGVIHAIDTVLVPTTPGKQPQADKPKDHPAH